MKLDCEAPPEFRLVTACCRWPPSEARSSAIAAASLDVTDWQKFVRVVKRQRVAGLVHNALTSVAVTVPSDIVLALAQTARQIALQNVRLAAEAARLQKVFADADIAVVFFKGTSLAQLAYGSISLKHGKDIDFLVAPEKAAAALALLEREGYGLWQPADFLSESQRRDVIRYSKEVALIHRNTRLQVELHWRLTDNSLLLENVDVSSRTQDVAIADGIRIRTFALPDLFAYLGVHGAVHGWSRLKWLADFNALIAGKRDAEIEQHYWRAEARGAGLCAGQALLLSCRLLGLKLPPALETQLQANRRLEHLCAFALRAMTGGNVETELEDIPFATTRNYLMHFFIGHGWRYVFAQLQTVSVSLYDMIQYPLPASLHFLYPVLRIPLWIWRRARNLGLGEKPVPPARHA